MNPGQHSNESRVASLHGARLPADLGLSSLGLLMQLAGSLALVFCAFIALQPVFAGGHGGSGVWYIFLLGSSGATRAAFHRAAGTSLIYGGTFGQRKPLMNYIIVSVITALIAAFVLFKMGAPAKMVLVAMLALMSWPATLYFMLNHVSYRRVLEQTEVTNSEDLGFEGAGVFMLILGVMGVLFSGMILLALFKLPGKALSSPQGMLFLGIFMMLFARSVIHSIAGFKATKGVDTASASDAAARYYSFGVVSAVIAAGAVLIMMMMTAFHPAGLLLVGFVLGGLLMWPVMLRRFYTEKNFSVLLAGSEGPVQRRAPDAGMTALGWILLGLGVYGIAAGLPALLLGEGGNPMSGLLGLGRGAVIEGPSPWWGIGVSGLQLWAGIELTRMTDRHKLAANIFGAVAIVVTLYTVWPELKNIGNALGGLGAGAKGMGQMIGQGSLAMNLVVPVVTIILANRKITPQATARITESGTPATPTTPASP